ncbi:nitroreductase family protein [Roseiflexus sp.]|uniref:Nitroreductase n=1 Tax=Roseiflexus castenholzii (strain DSM 13941 / HLO8) TaxID=383372 RepID=A7NR15_ROSCS|nr:nitroreductase family protein [Roseiflexus sp.]ABU60011.1 nitroreductase [Roseiflexus castenholzii DSM 13941]PMP87660.1 MAG: nitroreductase [Roseiflexus castenholzii]GIW02819.1 MAG: nitroreductase [Roseiflexus sp.]
MTAEPNRLSLSLAEIIRGRRSVRRLSDRPVAREHILAMLEAARWAPSPHGRQPWRFVVLTRAEVKHTLAAAMGEEWRRQLALDGQDAATIDTRVRKSYERMTSAPVVLLPCLYTVNLDVYPDEARNAAEITMAVQSLGCAIQNMLLTAYALGLDCGWMCAPLFCPETVTAALDLDPALIPHALITVGYAAVEPVRRERLPLEALIVRFD